MGPNPNGPLSKLQLLDTQVFSGSVQERSDRWRFLGMLFGVLNVQKNYESVTF